MKKHSDGELTNLSTFGIVEYTFGPLEWAGVQTLGVTYSITGLKVQTTVT
jgi:hypothetical protein